MFINLIIFTLSSLNRYDIDKDEWITFSMPSPTFYDGAPDYCTMCAHRGMIYLFIHKTNITEEERPRIRCYNPNDNAWRPVSHKHQNRSPESMFEYDDALYAIWENEENGLTEIDRYDDKTEEFVLVS